MQRTRALLRNHPALLAALLFCTLLIRSLVPAGYMPEVASGTITLTLCSGTMPAEPMTVAMPGMHHGDDHDGKPKAEQPCAFAGLAAPALGSTDTLLLAAALAFAFLVAIAPRPLRIAVPARLRPPLRAPPTV